MSPDDAVAHEGVQIEAASEPPLAFTLPLYFSAFCVSFYMLYGLFGRVSRPSEEP